MIRIIGKADVSARRDFVSRLRHRSIGLDSDLLAVVSRIIEQVRERGDKALVDYAAQFDDVKLNQSELRVSAKLLQESAERVSAPVLSTLREAIKNVRTFHERQCEQSWTISTGNEIQLGQLIKPIDSVGLYVPGGTAAYPSSVVMNVVPARVAGVKRVAVTTPPHLVRNNPVVAAALVELGVDEVYDVGGAQAIAALAFGTETIPKVDKITGPGNKYVAAAKKLVFGVVGIDSIAGPTEVLIIADEAARPDFIAADLLAQAEHGEDASAFLITTSEQLAHDVAFEVEQQVASLPRRAIVEKSLGNYGAILIVDTLLEACDLANEVAPEHLELLVSDADAWAQHIRHAGAIFIGPYSPECLGDYFAGPNHVLPTGSTARFSSALGVYDFVKRTTVIRYSREALQNVADKIAMLAEVEQLEGHARSARVRKQI